MARREVVSVFQVLRHTRNEGNEITHAGAALAFARGEETGLALGAFPDTQFALKKRGMSYWGVPSHQGRAIDTEAAVYQGMNAVPIVAISKRGGRTRPLPLMTDIKKTPEGEAVYKRESPAGKFPTLDASLQKWVRNEPQPHYAESQAELDKRLGFVKLMFAKLQEEAKQPGAAEGPVEVINIVTHSGGKARGPIERLAEHLTGKKLDELGGSFKHAEGVRVILYTDGTRHVQVLRQGHNEFPIEQPPLRLSDEE